MVMLTGFGDVMGFIGDEPDSVDVVVSKPATVIDLRAALAKVLPVGEVTSQDGGYRTSHPFVAAGT